MKRVIFGIVAAVIVVAALFGVGGMAYRMGIAQGAGYAALSQPRADGVVPPTEGLPNLGRGQGYAPGYPMPMQPGAYYGRGIGPMGGFGMMGRFNPFGGLLHILGSLFVLFLIFAVIRGLFFRRMGWGMRGMHGGPGGWRGHGEVPPWAMEWHRKMHEQQAAPPPANDAKPADDTTKA